MPKNPFVALETSDASIATATVTIRAIQVGKKQMTQAVFRQLPRGEMVDQDAMNIRGIPWGWVNHQFPNEPGGTHFIYQDGTILKRCPFYVRPSGSKLFHSALPPFEKKFRDSMGVLFDAYMPAIAAEGWKPAEITPYEIERFYDITIDGNKVYRGPYVFSYDTIKYVFSGPLDCWKDHAGNLRQFEMTRAAEIEKLKAEVARVIGWPMELQEIVNLIRGEMRDRARSAQRWDALMVRLSEIEQLFIAV